MRGMESQEFLVNGRISNGVDSVSCVTDRGKVIRENGLARVCDNEERKGNLAEDVLGDFEEYGLDIVISRMRRDFVAVTAVEEDVAGKIARMELEVVDLKECPQSHGVSGCRFEDVNFHGVPEEIEVGRSGRCSYFPNPCVKLDKISVELRALRDLVCEQFENAKKDVDFVRVANSFKQIGSDSELVGLGQILQEKQHESWIYVDRMLDCFKKTTDTVCTKLDGVLSSELEGQVLGSVFRRCKEDFEETSCERNAQFCGIHNANWLEKFNEISTLGPKLDAILKSLTTPETGMASHLSPDLDHLHHGAFDNHYTLSCMENGMLDATSIHVGALYDFQQLKHLSKQGLVDYFNVVISKMKRDHESAMHHKTEEYFRLKRKYLKENGPFAIHKKDKELDVPREKIVEVISKLDDFLSENEKLPALSSESIEKMEHRLESLLTENRVLRDCLTDKENELKHLEAQVAKLLKKSSFQESALKNVEKFNSAAEDARIEFLISKEIYNIILEEAVSDRYEKDDLDNETLIMEGLSGLVFAEVVKDIEETLRELSREVPIDKDSVIWLEMKTLELENELRLEVEEKEKLKQEIVDLGTSVKQKEKLAKDLSISLSKETERFELASQELLNLKEHASEQQLLVTETNRELQLLRSQHLEALEQIKVDTMEMQTLSRTLDQTRGLLTETNKQRDITFSCAQEMHTKLLLSEAREKKLQEEMEIAVGGISEMFNNFECVVLGRIERNTSRLEDMSLCLKDLNELANGFRRKGLRYKLKLEQRYAELQMAEAEVDLLGDEVDALLRVLWKVYIAIDHYSPVLKHYPGVIEILELVRRELSNESTGRL